ncbi:hypothetical protein KUW15_03915 [Qipengyuania aquimaris]|uniref:hypothetical protein n=1 Tax=Qipengyuania aquimaris TaxID=255984 RepID=UPI001C988B29|nr:hypothetical protein [Qipengyuania aquimaris]MBY6127856.1 hypothetical protein [Qipengyuania aquimaris]
MARGTGTRKADKVEHDGRYHTLPENVTGSPAFLHLSPRGMQAIFHLIRAFNGFNNGKIVMSARQLAHLMSMGGHPCTAKTAAAALRELAEHGLIAITQREVWRSGMAREYRLTFIRTYCEHSRTSVPASHEWKRWRPDPENKRQKVRSVTRKKGKGAPRAN